MTYLLAGQPTEIERLQLQARVWEPAGRELLGRLPRGSGLRALDLGCGALGWLRILSEWVGPEGSVVGSDFDDNMLDAARAFLDSEGIRNVTLVKDDLFASRLPPASFDLVHSRFQLTPLGKAQEQMALYRRLVRAGGFIVIEDPDAGSWRVNPHAPAVQKLIDLIVEGFQAFGGNLNAGREVPSLLRASGFTPVVEAHVVALPPGHPYLRLPLQFAASMSSRLETLIDKKALDDLLRNAEGELNRPDAWGTTFTLIQAYASVPAG